MQVAYDYRHLANVSCNLRETFVPLQTSPATCGRLSYPYKHLLQLAGDYRTPTNISCNLRETIVPLHTISCNLRETFVPLHTISCNLRETIVPLHTISCNLRETIVPLQTSPAICGRLSYPYKHLLQSAGDLRTPTKKCFSIFFAYDLCFLSKALLLFH